MVEELTEGLIRFRLDCNSGPPTYDFGIAEGRIPLSGGVAIWHGRSEDSGCQLSLTFGKADVTIVQTGSGVTCGFTASLSASGRYRRLSTAVPSWDLRVGVE